MIPGRVHQQLQHVRAVGEPGRPAAAAVGGQGTRSQVRTAQAPEGHRQDRRGFKGNNIFAIVRPFRQNLGKLDFETFHDRL